MFISNKNQIYKKEKCILKSETLIRPKITQNSKKTEQDE